MKPKIFIGSDHAGYDLKNTLRDFLRGKGYEVKDVGPESLDKKDDYPEHIIRAAEAVSKHENSRGIVLGHSGQGEALAANKVDSIRAALYYGEEKKIIELSRKHNDSNVLSLGAGFLEKDEAKKRVLEWLNTDFTAKKRHVRRLEEIELYENQKPPELLPAILAESQQEMDEEFEKVLQYSQRFHIDVEDGKFVENRSLDFDYTLPDYQRYEAHLMVEKPLKWIKDNLEKFERFNFHIEADCDPKEVIEYLKSKGKDVGIAVNPDTPIEEIMNYVHEVDLVQIMTVDPGNYGSEFHEKMVERIKRVRREHPEISIEVDGHVRPENSRDLKEAGANLFVSGSYVQESEDPGRAIRDIEREIGIF